MSRGTSGETSMPKDNTEKKTPEIRRYAEERITQSLLCTFYILSYLSVAKEVTIFHISAPAYKTSYSQLTTDSPPNSSTSTNHSPPTHTYLPYILWYQLLKVSVAHHIPFPPLWHLCSFLMIMMRTCTILTLYEPMMQIFIMSVPIFLHKPRRIK